MFTIFIYETVDENLRANFLHALATLVRPEGIGALALLLPCIPHPTAARPQTTWLPSTIRPPAPECPPRMHASARPRAAGHAGKLVVDLRPFVIKVISSGASGEGIFGLLQHFRYRSRAPVCSLSRFNGKNQANRLYGKCPGFLKCSC